MNDDLALVATLRRAFELVSRGMGLAEALVRSLPSSGTAGKDVARRILLGFPVSASLGPMLSGSDEVAALALLLGTGHKSGAKPLGQSGERVSLLLEGWIKLRESRKLEERVQRFRSLIVSCVVGGVSAMIATLGPILSSLYSTTTGLPDGTGLTLYAGAAMAATSSAMLAIYVSERRFYLNVALSLISFVAVWGFVSPLASFTVSPLLLTK